MSRFTRIVNNNLCLGCGLCESLGKGLGYNLSLRPNGFYSIEIPNDRNVKLEQRMANCCPSVSLLGDGSTGIWGGYKMMARAHSTDNRVRHHASSGGFVSAICQYALENGFCGAVLQVGVDPKDPLQNKLLVSRSSEIILSRASSRYAPAKMFTDLKQILDSSEDTFLFVGKSCDVLALKNFTTEYPEYVNRIWMYISILCGGMPSYNATKRIIETLGDITPVSLKYRGDGWPGSFSVQGDDGREYRMEYPREWNEFLGPALHFRCKICPDSIGSLSDISVGDAWNVIDGKPVFKEGEGESCIIVRTDLGEGVVRSMIKDFRIIVSDLPECILSQMQPNHIRKRLSSAFKILVMKMITPGLIKTKDLNLVFLGSKYNILKGVRDMFGAYRRFRRWHHQ